MKDFILSVGDSVTNISAFLFLVLFIGSGFVLVTSGKVALGLGVFLIGPGILVEIFYLAYCIIDIRESLKKIAENTNKKID